MEGLVAKETVRGRFLEARVTDLDSILYEYVVSVGLWLWFLFAGEEAEMCYDESPRNDVKVRRRHLPRLCCNCRYQVPALRVEPLYRNP